MWTHVEDEREELVARFNNDMAAMTRYLQEKARRSGRTFVSFPPRRIPPEKATPPEPTAPAPSEAGELPAEAITPPARP